MKFVSTNNKAQAVSFKDALSNGLAEDGGLYVPQKINKLKQEYLDELDSMSFVEIGEGIAKPFIGEEIPSEVLSKIVNETLSFEIPLIGLSDNISVLELFHGPTMAFKDVGARFMARCLSYFTKDKDRDTTVLVATSGDTGSAVAHGFYGVEGIKVVILYPKGKVSEFQERQMTTLGKNITTLEVDGTFDDCQRMVKAAFKEDGITENIALTSANSINIARLIPQMFYYFIAYQQRSKEDLVFSVPSGNYGNLTAGLMAKKLGLPIKKFVASSNVNEIVPDYLKTGEFSPKDSIQTISNAMDVGNPSNFARMMYLYDGSLEQISKDVEGCSFNDADTRNIIWKVWDNYNYVMDPHGAIGYLGLIQSLESFDDMKNTQGIFLETAHPSKFREVVEPVLEEKISYPEDFEMDSGPKLSIPLKNDMEQLKEILIS
ncbi:MAG: threonine synthase [Saprospiraceae bacterium]|nr:threonine synthase [Saprospiraceae bacterium]